MSKNLLFTEVLQQDVSNIVEACNDEVTRYYLVTLPYPYTKDDAIEFIDNSAKQWEAGSVLRWALRCRTTEEFIGVVELRYDCKFDSIGVWCAPKMRGNGYITEAIKTIVKWSVEQKWTKNNEIYYACMPQNIPSASVARSVGFKLLGAKQSHEPYIHRDTGMTYQYLYSIYAPDDIEQFSSWSEYL
ncbi:MAG: GNAT family N-acetyltransferase [Candidatus Ancillula sp.]|nr:GNAT family N-acetyltransferase [Candidatus Ancillula sp.]